MNFYLSAVDDLLRHADDAPSIGLILCKDKNRIVVEYALRDTGKPMEWIIDKAPVIERYQNERQVEYIFDANTYQLWIDSDEEPLRSASIFARNSGIRRVEMMNLEKDCVIIREDPDEDGNWGDLIIKRGLKRRARKRVLKINKESQSVLENLISQSKCRYVFSQPRHPDRKLEPWILESEMGRLREKLARDKIKLDSDAGLHTLRHRFLTEAGEHTDAFTLQYIAGHDTIKTTMR
jgi:integrase